jgi:hypothetical protein
MTRGKLAGPPILFKPMPGRDRIYRAQFCAMSGEIKPSRNPAKPWLALIWDADGAEIYRSLNNDLSAARRLASASMRCTQERAMRAARVKRAAARAAAARIAEAERVDMAEAAAERDMRRGWIEGGSRTAPPPGGGASASYRHGFTVRRADASTRSAAQWRAMAAAAIAHDVEWGVP